MIVRCLEAWRHFLEETTTKFEIWIDHKNLEYFMKVQKLNRRQARWILYLSRFDWNKNHTEQPVGKLMPNLIPEKSWTHILADFITKLPLAQGYDLILVVVDRLTKMVHFISTIERTSAKGLARLFRDNV